MFTNKVKYVIASDIPGVEFHKAKRRNESELVSVKYLRDVAVRIALLKYIRDVAVRIALLKYIRDVAVRIALLKYLRDVAVRIASDSQNRSNTADMKVLFDTSFSEKS